MIVAVATAICLRTPPRAALLAVAAFEGALVLARAERSSRAIRECGRMLARHFDSFDRKGPRP